MSRRTAEANKAIVAAWEKEQQLVKEGKGTRDWTPEQQKDILEKGKAYDENGKAFEGHHMVSVENNPDFQGCSDNIQFLSRPEHRDAHGGNFQNSTNGYFNPETGETCFFEDGTFKPCDIISLSNPISTSVSPLNSKEVPVEENESNKENNSEKEKIEDTYVDARTYNEQIEQQYHPYKQSISTRPEGFWAKVKRAAKVGFDFAVDYAKEHKEELIINAISFGLRVATDAYLNRSSNKNQISTQRSPSAHKPSEPVIPVEKTINDAKPSIVDTIQETTERASPIEHTVKPHGQHYGKDKVWKEKAAYSRGAKK